MTITYPLSLPARPAFSRQMWSGTSVVGLARSGFTLAQQVQKHQGEAPSCELTLPPMPRADAENWVAFLLSLRGRYGTFLMGDVAGAAPRGSVPGTPLAFTAGSPSVNYAGASVLHTKGWTANRSGVLLPGDWIQYGSGSTARLHKVLAAANSDASGFADLDIFPSLRELVSDGAALVTSNCVGRFRLPDNRTDWDIGAAVLYGITFSAIEVLP